MKFKIKTIAFAACALMLGSCSNDEYEFDNLFPEEYHNIVYLKGDKTGAAVVYETGDEASMVFPLMRGGSDPSTSAEVEVVAVPQKELDNFNMGYVAIPADCYKFDGNLSFAPKEQYKEVKVVYDLDKLKAFIATMTEGQNPVIALKINNSNATVNSEKDRIIRTLTVERPTVGFSSEKIQLGFAVGKIDITTTIDATNQWDFTCDIDYGNIADKVEEYNIINGTNYEALTEDKFEISGDKMEFSKGSNTASVEVSLKDGGKSLDLSKEYLLPLKITDCTKTLFQLNPDECYVVVSGKVLITLDMLSSPCTQGDDGAGLPGLIDNDPSTFWQSVWKTQYLDATYGHYFEVKLNAPLNETLKFGYTTRDYAPILPLEIKIFVSGNGKSWKELAHLTKENDGLCDTSSSFTSVDYELSEPVSYVRYCVLKTNNGRTGVDGSASTAITGFSLWGK